MKENWKVAQINSRSIWEVSDQGHVKCNGKLYDYSNCKGYVRLNFGLLHRKIAELFVPNPDNKPCVDHIDGDKTNNSAKNLRWVTHYENIHNPNTFYKISKSLMGHKIPEQEKLKHGRKGERHPRFKTKQMYKDGEYLTVNITDIQKYLDDGWIFKGRPWSKNHI